MLPEGNLLDRGLGLGGRILELDSMQPVGASEVVSPSSTYSIGDGFAGKSGRIRDGWSALWRIQFTDESTYRKGSTERAQKRHAGQANILFCDGHVGPVTLDVLFTDESDAALSSWNRDGKPHRDRLTQ